jgi:hypothetical protein
MPILILGQCFIGILIVSLFLAITFFKNDSGNPFIRVLSQFIFLLLFTSLTIQIDIANQQRLLILLVLSLLGLILRFAQFRISIFAWCTSILASMAFLNYLLSRFLLEKIVQFMTFGYDHAYHLVLYKSFIAEERVAFVGESWQNNFSLFKDYPFGQPSAFAFVRYLLYGNLVDTRIDTTFYFVANCLLLITPILLIVAMNKTAWRTKQRSSLFLHFTIAFFAIFICALPLTNGYPPYLFGLFVIVILIFAISEESDNDLKDMILIISALFLLTQSQPLLIPNVLLPLGYLSYLRIGGFRASLRDNFRQIILFTIFTASLLLDCLFVFSNSTSSWNLRVFNVLGGQAISRVFWLSAVVFTVILFVTHLVHRHVLSHLQKLFALAVLNSCCFSGVLLLVGWSWSNGLNYYALKNLYVTLSLLIFLGLIFLVSSVPQSRSGLLSRRAIMSLISLQLFFSQNPQGYFTSAFMGPLSTVAYASFNSTNMDDVPLDAHLLLETMTKEPRTPSCLIYRLSNQPTDLGSRWLAALSRGNLVNDNCFSLYWNAEKKPLRESLLESTAQAGTDLTVVFFVDSKEYVDDDFTSPYVSVREVHINQNK